MKNIAAQQWWQRAVFYQIYPRSFADGNGDGIGDFTGMIGKLDYLQQLGVDAIWLSPHFPSPYMDCGYDVSNYRDVAPEYGSMPDFIQFLDGLHQRGMKLVLDLVLNHTSDQHPWFIESRSSLDNPKRDWYIWKEGEPGQPPNNWFSTFGGSAWEYDERTSAYYYHYFFKEQPDLNWKNPKVKEAMFSAARYWLDLGVDGFRLDAIGTIFEDENYPSIPDDMSQEELYRLARGSANPDADEQVLAYWMGMFRHQSDRPEVHVLMKELRNLIDEYEDRVLIGETDDIAFYGNGDDELHLNFNFPLMRTLRLTADHVRNNQRARLAAMPKGAWPCNTLGNHDSARVYSMYGDGKNDALMARLHLMLLLTLKGTPFLYNGEEIGMSDLLIEDPVRFRDPLSLLYAELERKVMQSDQKTSVLVGAKMGRDRNRTPMQWSDTANAGFCPSRVEPWLPVNPNYRSGVNVTTQDGEPDSLLNFYRRMITFRKEYSALQTGDYQEIDGKNEEVLVYRRWDETDDLTVALNLSDTSQRVNLPYEAGRNLFSNRSFEDGLLPKVIELLPYQGVIIHKKPSQAGIVP